jgi:lycopene cyclase domain-containing protein
VPSSSAYLFLELAIVVFVLGFCWEEWRPRELMSRVFWRPALGLAVVWFAIDEVAVRLGLWSFPAGGTLPTRVLALPLEECALFVLHTLLCMLLLRHYSRAA